ncbi:hypothetical protein [Altererythrobacter sp. CC-YST694]|uniref:hypothetical protein n=1 Tax=Altererythrobacter sp. CC-YST694 TaxID=2755038 RepID=UPI00299F743C|nr:hypothetical protein [Altererythrobacter sp. CC-YST694]
MSEKTPKSETPKAKSGKSGANMGMGTKAAIAGAAIGIGSAAVAAALLFANRRKQKNEPEQLPPIPSGEPPETD